MLEFRDQSIRQIWLQVKEGKDHRKFLASMISLGPFNFIGNKNWENQISKLEYFPRKFL